jgi:uncharacterized protein (TIGR02246 family)
LHIRSYRSLIDTMRKDRLLRTMAVLFTSLLLALLPSAIAQNNDSGIEKVRSRWVASFNAKDISGLMALYADGAALLPPSGEHVTGKENIRAYFQRRFDAATTLNVKLTNIHSDSSGALGFDSGRYEQTVVRAGAAGQASSRGSYLLVVKRDKENWVIVQHAMTEAPPSGGTTIGGRTTIGGSTTGK